MKLSILFGIKKRVLLFVSLLVTGLAGTIGGYLREHYDVGEDSLLTPTAHADVQNWAWGFGDGGDGGGGEGSGESGGCSGDGDSGP